METTAAKRTESDRPDTVRVSVDPMSTSLWNCRRAGLFHESALSPVSLEDDQSLQRPDLIHDSGFEVRPGASTFEIATPAGRTYRLRKGSPSRLPPITEMEVSHEAHDCRRSALLFRHRVNWRCPGNVDGADQ